MAATATEHKLLIDGEWVETGDWIEVLSPYSGALIPFEGEQCWLAPGQGMLLKLTR